MLARARKVLAEADNLIREATTGHTRLRIGHAWSAMGRHTAEYQRRWAARYPDVELHLIRTNSATGGLAEGLCDLAVVRTAFDDARFASAVVGHERRYCAMAADDPWARRRSIALCDIRERTLLIDRRTGTTTADLWPESARPVVEYTQDIDDWLARDRHRPQRRHHAGEHRQPVPPRRHRLPAAAGRGTHRGPPHLAAP